MSVTSAHMLPALQFLPGLDASQQLSKALDLIDQAHEIQLPEPDSLQPYSRQVLLDTPDLVVIAARWRAGAKCDLHGHTDSVGLYRIISGTVEEERYLPTGDQFTYQAELLAQGDESLLPSGSFQQLRALEETITLHAYSPRPADPLAEVSQVDRTKLVAARRNYKPQPQPRRIEFPQWGVKSSRHDKTIEKIAADLAPRWGKYEAAAYDDDSSGVPLRVLEEIRSSGILAAPLPRYSGGWTASLTETARALTQIATHAPASALALVGPLANAATCRIPLSAVPREHAETLRANQRWIAEQVTRGRILAVADSQPSVSEQQIQTVASRGIDGHYYLTGQKSFASLGADADYFLLPARTAVDIEGPRGPETTVRVEAFFVHRDAPGVTFNDQWEPVGRRPKSSADINFKYAPAERIFGYPGCWETVNARHWSTLLLSAVFIGIGQAALREGLQKASHSVWARAKFSDHALALDAAAGYLEATCEAEAWSMPKELLGRVERVKAFATQTVIQTAAQVAIVSGERHSMNHLLANACGHL